MPLVTAYDGFTWKSYPIPTKTVVAHVVQSGLTTLDPTNNAQDKAHLLLHGSLPSDEFYIKCEKVNGTIPFSVDHSGKVVCPDVTLPSGDLESTISAIKVDVESTTQDANINFDLINAIDVAMYPLSSAIDAATSLATENTLVKRGLDGTTTGTMFNRVTLNKLSAGGPGANIAVYGDAAFSYVRQDEQGNNLTGLYRLGGNTENVFDISSAGDGLHFNDNNNQLLCQVQQDAPQIRIEGLKDAGVNYIEIRDDNNVLLFAVDRNGHFVGPHLLDDLSENLPDSEVNEAYLGDTSLYIGPVRLSFDDGKIKFSHLTTIPQVLAAAPFNITSADLSGRDPDELSARQWLALARNKVSDHTIRGKDVFTVESEWTDMAINFASTLTSDCQTQLEAIKTDITELDTFAADADQDINDLEAAIVLKAPLENPSFGTKITVPKIHAHTIMSQQNHLKLGSEHTNDCVIYLNSGGGSSQETLQITRSGIQCRLTTNGGSGELRSMQKLICSDGVDVPTGKAHTVNGVDVVAVERARIDGILNLSNQDLDTLIEIETAFKAADSSIETTVVNLTNSAATARAAIQTDVDQNEADGDTDRALIRSEFVAADTVVRNFAVAADTVLSTAYIAADLVVRNFAAAGDAALQTEVDVNTAKTGISSQQTSDITANNAKTGISSQQTSDITANNSKTGISVQQTADITLNNAKVTYDDAATVSSHVTLHTQHATALGNKINTSGHQTMDGRLTVQNDGNNGVVSNPHADDLQVYHYNDCGITIGAPYGKIGTLAFSDQNKADRNEIRSYSTAITRAGATRNIGMHHFSNQTSTSSDVPTMSVCSQLVGINNSQPIYALSVSGSVGYNIVDQGDVTANVTLATACSIWKLNPTNTPPKVAYVPDPSSNAGRLLA